MSRSIPASRWTTPPERGAHIGRMADPSRARCDVREQCLAGGVDDLATAAGVVSANHATTTYLPLLERFYRSHRMVDTIELEETSANASMLDATEFIAPAATGAVPGTMESA